MSKSLTRNVFFRLFIFILFFTAIPQITLASVVDELKEKIGERSGEIEKLESEIKEFETQIEHVGNEAETLKGAIQTLNITDKKLGTDIRVTKQKTTATALEIEKLGIEIIEREEKIEQNGDALGEVIRNINELSSRSLVEILLSNVSFATFWGSLESLERFQARVRTNLKELQSIKSDLENKKGRSESEKKNLLVLTAQLADQKVIVEENKKTKSRLLAETQNKESSYKMLLEDRLAQKEALEQEIQEFEARIRIEIDPASLPETKTGVLRWPLDTVTITQYFGNTPFASQNSQVYNGRGHNGIDLRASIGTPIKAAAGGIVSGIGDTDKECYKVSYGKWVLINHQNGLSTLYAHLSLARVALGTQVEMGGVLGYSGNTGYSTGPHLHFAVFATKAITVSDRNTNPYKSKICGTFLTLPLVALNGYLNPLSYLPTL